MRYVAIYLFVTILFVVDRIIKIWFYQNPAFQRDFISGVLEFRYATNTGIAFGWQLHQFIILALVLSVLGMLGFALAQAYRQRDRVALLLLLFIFAGAVSNVIDRFRFGFVVDYINVPFFTVFNLADTMITIGAIGLAALVLLRPTGQQK